MVVDVRIEIDLPDDLLSGNKGQDGMIHGASGELDLAVLGQLTKTLDHIVESVSSKLLCQDSADVEGDPAAGGFPQSVHECTIALRGDLADYCLGLGRRLIYVKEIAPIHGSRFPCLLHK